MSEKMKRYIISLLFLAFPLAALSADWKYELSEALSKSKNEEDVDQYSINLEIVDDYIERIAKHAKEYPPRFTSKEEYEDVAEKLNGLIGVLAIVSENQQNNPELLLRLGFVQSMAHNININGAADKAKENYEKLLKISPNNIKGNYLFGMFLSGTRKYHFDSIPFLEKALALGETDSQYTLGLLYYEQGDKEKGLKYLRKYSENNPEQDRVKKVINAIETGKLKFNHD